MPQLAFHKLKKNRPRNGHNASSNPAELSAGMDYSLPNPNRHLRTPRAGALTQNLGLQAFAELHTERLYLLNRLQCENSKSIDILRKISALEEDLMLGTASLGRRGTKSKLARLKYRMKETERREQAILAHLGRLSFEIQSLDRWMSVEAERHEEFRYVEPSRGKRNPQKYIQRNESQKGQVHFAPIGELESKPESHSRPSLGVGEAEQAIGMLHDSTCIIMNDDLCLHANIADNTLLQKYSKIPRSSSMESVELALMETGSSFESVLRAKRNSI
jgi:hypothetical protein